jgi:hypothetical protein
MNCQISSAQYNTMHSLLNGKYIRLPVKNTFCLNLHKRDFKVSALIGICFVQIILKDKPLTSYAFSGYVYMKTNLLLYTENERYQATGKQQQDNIQRYSSE